MASNTPPPQERIRFVSDPDLPGLELMLVQQSARLFRIFHESYDICVIPFDINAADAASYWKYRRWHQVARPGGIMLMEPGETHATVKITRPGTYWVAQFAATLVAAAAAESRIAATHLRVCQTTDPRWARHLEAFRQACCSHATLLERQSRLAACLEALVQRYCEDGPKPLAHAASTLRRARDFIVEYYDKPVALDDLVALTGLSGFHLIRCFAQQYGVPPHQYQILVRVERARELLRAGCPPVLVDVGFADQSHLTRHFKRVLGVTPAAYQRQVRPSRLKTILLQAF